MVVNATNRTYITRLQKLLEVVQRVPDNQVDLLRIGIDARAEVAKHGINFTTRQVAQCGSVGCILGWAMTIPSVRRNVGLFSLGGDIQQEWDALCAYYGHQDSSVHAGFFSPRNETDSTEGSDKDVAITRIQDAIVWLQTC